MKDNFLMCHLDNIAFLAAALIKDAKSADEKGKRGAYGFLSGMLQLCLNVDSWVHFSGCNPPQVITPPAGRN